LVAAARALRAVSASPFEKTPTTSLVRGIYRGEFVRGREVFAADNERVLAPELTLHLLESLFHGKLLVGLRKEHNGFVGKGREHSGASIPL
jgi:hypothetical protein